MEAVSMQTISVMNAKGGVAKTTTALCLAEYLGNQGQKVLLVDLDPQANATNTLLKVEVGDELEGKTLYNVIYDQVMSKVKGTLPEAIRQADYVDVAPASLDLEMFKELAKTKSRNPLKLLEKTLSPVKKTYDFVILDCPADLSVYVESAIHISDLILLPSSYDAFGFQGINLMIQAMFEVHDEDYRQFRVLYTQDNARATRIKSEMNRYEKMLAEMDVVLPFMVPLDQNVKNAQARQHSLMANPKYKKSKARAAYEQLGAYVMKEASA